MGLDILVSIVSTMILFTIVLVIIVITFSYCIIILLKTWWKSRKEVA